MNFKKGDQIRLIDEVYDIFLKAGWTISSNVGVIKDISEIKLFKSFEGETTYIVSFDNIVTDKGIKMELISLFANEIEHYDTTVH